MKRVRTSDLCPGMRTGEDVYSYNNQMILPKDTILTDKMITRLEFYSVLAIRIAEDGDFPESPEISEEKEMPLTNDAPYSEKIKASKEFQDFEKQYLNTAKEFENTLNKIASGEEAINSKELMKTITDLIGVNSSSATVTNLAGPNRSSASLLNMLHNMRQYDDFTYMHCMNVSLLSNVLGQWLGLNDHDLEILTVGGLLHDIGKLTVPDDIIRKPGKLSPSEYNIIKTHTVQGYKILQANAIDENMKDIALMHHERCDGSGYPLGLTGDKISPYAKITAIADVYDAMTAARIYRGPLCPFKVISIFETEGYQKYDSKFILTFLEHIAESYMNNRVRLSNGKEGDVVFMNKNALSKTLIQCGNEFIDLSKETNIYIETFV